ncbi:hypothetical protein GO001_14960 [Streptomyces sp. NRRL B-1677]|uniref:hypothetical protein n=1 Tax=Streptomyces TaxID=1883 RepID=UPI0018928A01|nr:hypothetical protein [Streptomyces sp. NRRL B-1677]MBF6046511.1 hypothetical protein [Streptomyces sp. NRRL B-1677]
MPFANLRADRRVSVTVSASAPARIPQRPAARHSTGWALAMLGVTALWGWTYVVVQDAVALLPVPAFLAYRFHGAAAFVALFQYRGLARMTAREVAGGAVAGGVLFAVYALQTAGLQDTTVSNAAPDSPSSSPRSSGPSPTGRRRARARPPAPSWPSPDWPSSRSRACRSTAATH